MKIRRILGLFMALMMVVSLCACAGGTKDVDLEDALKSINKEFSISEDSMIMIEDTDTLELYYKKAKDEENAKKNLKITTMQFAKEQF